MADPRSPLVPKRREERTRAELVRELQQVLLDGFCFRITQSNLAAAVAVCARQAVAWFPSPRYASIRRGIVKSALELQIAAQGRQAEDFQVLLNRLPWTVEAVDKNVARRLVPEPGGGCDQCCCVVL